MITGYEWVARYSLGSGCPTQLPHRTCTRCGHTWVPRQVAPPQQCPKCRSAYWAQARKRMKKEATEEEQNESRLQGGRRWAARSEAGG